jgi:hypothetical protein
MPAPYPQPAFNTSIGMFEYTNTITSGWALVLFCIAMPVIIFVLLKNKLYRTSDSLVVAFFLSLMMSVFLWGAGLIASKVMMVLLLLTIASALYSAFDRD